ncbi:MAG: putative quinol monooxygenase [Geitlerinemataceae cyanobacterium]
MSAVLTIVARIEAEPDRVDFFRAELLKPIGPTRQEDGCLQYDLHQDNNDPSVFVFYENWTSRDLWQVHMNNSHIQEYLKNTEGAVKSFVLNEMKRCD